jgi:hypothetical protein
MLHIAALFVAGSATLDEDGAINATRIPTTCFEVDEIPLWTKVPVVLVVHAPAGGDYNPQLYVVCKDPAGQRSGTIEASWYWADDGDKPSKYRCFTQLLPLGIPAEGEYTIGVYYDTDGKFEMSTPIPISIMVASAGQTANNDVGAEQPIL